MIYEPKEDSYLLAKEIKRYAKDLSVLDIGSGSGILAQTALQAGAKSVIASDIDKESINHIKMIGIKSLHSNLFQNIRGKFDLIVFNPPYLPKDKREDKKSAVATTGGKKGDEIILRFLKQSKSHLNKKGIILLLLSSLTPKDRISILLKKLNLKSRCIAKESFFFEELFVWKIQKR